MAKRYTYTSCPEEYDGFGTRTVRLAGRDQKGRVVRLVETPDGHAEWQRQRYHSGCVYLVADEGQWTELVGFGLVSQIEPCAEDCLGWAHFNIGEDREGIERCDECAVYPDDDAAARAHERKCQCGAGVGKPAERCHGCRKSADTLLLAEVEGQLLCRGCRL